MSKDNCNLIFGLTALAFEPINGGKHKLPELGPSRRFEITTRSCEPLPMTLPKQALRAKLFLILILVACWPVRAQCSTATLTFDLESRLKETRYYLEPVAAKDVEPLRPGELLTRQITGGESQSFSIRLTTGQYADISIEQHGSILVSTLIDPQGTEVIQMDFPAGGYGPICLSTIASLTGEYRLEIRSTNKWAKAASYEVALKTLRSPEAPDQANVNAQLLFAQGRKSIAADDAAAAIELYDKSLAYWRASQNYHWQALTQYALSQAYRNLSNRQKTEECLDETIKTLNLQMAPNDWRIKASALNDLGAIYAAVGQTEKSLSVLTEALNLYIANQDQRGQASALNNIAIAHGAEGDFSLAREFVEKALALRRAENDLPGIISLLNALGVISERLGEPDVALNYFAQALHGWEALGELSPDDRLRFALLLNNLAAESDRLGKWDQALNFYDRALDKYKEGDPSRAPVLDNKGELYLALGNPVKAKECYDGALKLLESGKPAIDIKAGVLVHLGQLAVVQGDLITAVSYFEQAQRIQPHPAKLADVLTNLGAALAVQGDLEKSLHAYQSAWEIQVKLKDRRGQALTLQKRGEAHALRGDQTEALQDLNQALLLWKSVKDQRGVPATLGGIARMERGQGNLSAALAHSDEAIAIIESLRTSISRRQLQTSYFATQENYYELAVDLRMQISRNGAQLEFVAAALESSEKARARVLLETLNEADIGRGAFTQSDSRLAELVEQRAELKRRLDGKAQARVKLSSGAAAIQQLAAIDREIDAISEKYDELEALIRARNPRIAELNKPSTATLKQIQAQLDPDTLLLEYSLGEQRSYVWAVTPDSIKGFELKGRKEIEDAAERMNKALTERNRSGIGDSPQQIERRRHQADAEYSKASGDLSKLVIQPVAALLGSKRLVIVADGALQLVSFGALPGPNGSTPSSGGTAKASTPRKTSATNDPKLLIEDHEIVYEASASVLALQRKEFGSRQPARHALAVLADPVFNQEGFKLESEKRRAAKVREGKPQPGPDSSGPSSEEQARSRSDLMRAIDDMGIGSISALPESRDEAEAIMKVVPKGEGLSALGFDASRATVMSPGLAQYRIVHFATHGFADFDHPELSGIVLSQLDAKGQPQDGFIRLHDIYNLNLPADLVVLSACQTGVGKQIRGEGLIALTRGFIYAGAARVVASLWKVDDEATKYLMIEFYKQMFTNGLKPAAALAKGTT